jgi:hypothetical protein
VAKTYGGEKSWRGKKLVGKKLIGKRLRIKSKQIRFGKNVITHKVCTELLTNLYPMIHWLKCKNIYPGDEQNFYKCVCPTGKKLNSEFHDQTDRAWIVIRGCYGIIPICSEGGQPLGLGSK